MICTNRPASTALLLLESFELNRFFDAISFGDSFMYKKPDGRHTLDTLNMVASETACAAMVGVNVTGIAVAKDASVYSVLVTFGDDVAAGHAAGPLAETASFEDLPVCIAHL